MIVSFLPILGNWESRKTKYLWVPAFAGMTSDMDFSDNLWGYGVDLLYRVGKPFEQRSVSEEIG